MANENERLSTAILQEVQRQPEGTPLSAKGLLHLGSRAAVDQALSRLVQRGALMRAGRGVYVLPVEGRFGRRAPSVEKTIDGLAAQRGEQIVVSGAMAANALGLTTQVPVRPVYLTSGRARTLHLGQQQVELRHAPQWQLALGNAKAGQAVRAIAWMGKEHVEASANQVRSLLTPEERKSLASVAAQLPGWLAGPVGRLAHA